MLNSKNRVFNPYFSIGNGYLSNEKKNTFADNSRAELTIFFSGKTIVFFECFFLAILWAILRQDCPRSFNAFVNTSMEIGQYLKNVSHIRQVSKYRVCPIYGTKGKVYKN